MHSLPAATFLKTKKTYGEDTSQFRRTIAVT